MSKMSSKEPLSATNLAILENNQRALFDMCLSIEEVSSSNIGEIESATCDQVADCLLPLLAQTQQLEEHALFGHVVDFADSSCRYLHRSVRLGHGTPDSLRHVIRHRELRSGAQRV